MDILQLSEGPAVDNAPDAATCPDWLLLLDDPEPNRVIFVGRPDPAIHQWFVEAGAHVWAHDAGVTSPPADLVVIAGNDRKALGRQRARSALIAELAEACGPEAALVAPWPAGDETTQELTKHGFITLRPIRATLVSPPRGRGPGGFVAVRNHDAAPHPDAPPSWLAAFTENQPWAPGPGGWSLRVPSAYPSQKAVLMLGPTAGATPTGVLKLTRHPRFNSRLDNEFAQLRGLTSMGRAVGNRAPAALATGRVAGMSAVVEEVLQGRPFLEMTSFKTNCPLGLDAVAAITELGTTTAQPVPGLSFADPLSDLLDRFVARNRPPDLVAGFLADQIAVLAESQIPGVLFHGDMGTWNLLVSDGSVRILDWESAETPGPPLWDLMYFVRSLAVRSGRRRGLGRNRAIRRNLTMASPFNAAATDWFRSYATRVGLPAEVLAPLFHLCWMHRAVKENARLAPDQPGHYGPLCSHLVMARDQPGLRNLLAN